MPRHALAALGLIAALLALRPAGTSGAELLTNRGFESGPWPWGQTAGVLDTVDEPVHGGVAAGRLTGAVQQIHEVYQSLDVQAGAVYNFSGWVYLDGGTVSRVFLKARWFDSGGSEIYNEQSAPLTIPRPEYRAISTEVMTAPDRAVRARFGILVEPNGPFKVYLDDFSVEGPVYTPAPTPVPTPQPTATPSPPPPPNTPPASTQAPGPPPTAVPVERPQFFSTLTNGGFEDLDGDGAPYGWRKIGGQMSVVAEPRLEGSRALRFVSATTSTKWVYQTVSVEQGAYYEASVSGLKNDVAVETVLLRLSWYGTENGEGSAIGSVDSLESLTTDAPTFLPLTTGAVQAPVDARSVRVKLMLRPVSAAPATGYFDDVRLTRVPPPALVPPGHQPGAAVSARRTGASPTGTMAALGSVSTPVVPANVRARPTPVTLATAGHSGDGALMTYASMTVAAALLAVAGFGLWRRRAGRSSPED